jgi:hypothetical protein
MLQGFDSGINFLGLNPVGGVCDIVCFESGLLTKFGGICDIFGFEWRCPR